MYNKLDVWIHILGIFAHVCLVLTLDYVLSYDLPGSNDIARPLVADKRSALLRPFAFPCNGYDNIPRCLHGGKGPRKTYTKTGNFCVCFCPSRWAGPECGFSASPGIRRKRDDEMESTAEGDDVVNKEQIAPFDIIKNVELEADTYDDVSEDLSINIPNNRQYNYQDYNANDHMTLEEEDAPIDFPTENINTDKRPYPWMVWGDAGTKSVPYTLMGKRIRNWNPVRMRFYNKGVQWKYLDGTPVTKRNNPWQILDTPEVDRRQGPWRILNANKRSGPWNILDRSQRTAPRDEDDKRSAPWLILNRERRSTETMKPKDENDARFIDMEQNSLKEYMHNTDYKKRHMPGPQETGKQSNNR